MDTRNGKVVTGKEWKFKTLVDKVSGKVMLKDQNPPIGGIAGKLVEVPGENTPGNEVGPPMVTVTGALNDG